MVAIMPTLGFDPVKGSFWDRPQFGVLYVQSDEDNTVVIGKVSRVARNRFKWSRYAKPIKVTTTAKTEPKVAESHFVSRQHTGVWAVKLSHRNASK